MSHHGPAHYDVDDEPEYAGTYAYPAVVHEYKNAWKRIKTPLKSVEPVQRKPVRGTCQAAKVLKVAQRLYQPGDVVSPKAIGEEMGISRQTVNNAITVLRRAGQWPYRGGAKGLPHSHHGDGSPLVIRNNEVLAAAAKLCQPGEPASPKAIGEACGLSQYQVNACIGYLKQHGLWLYARMPRGRKTKS